MKHLVRLVIFLISMLVFGAATDANAGTLSARAKGHTKGVTFKKRCQTYRVNDCGKPLRCWRQQVTYRATNDTFIKRSQGQATARDENSSPVMIFHTKCDRKLRCGHVYQRRGN